MIPISLLEAVKKTLAVFMVLWPAVLPAATDKQAAKTEISSEVKRLVSAAKDKGERQLVLTWDGAALGGPSGSKRFEALFNRMYGTDIVVNYTPGPTMPQMAGKLTQEIAAGVRPTSDIYLGNIEHFASMVHREVLEEYDYSRLSPRISKRLVAPKNIGVEIYSSTPVIIYNTKLISAEEAPKRLEDVLNPKWKGRIASTPYAAYFERVAVMPGWGVEKTRDFVRKLSQHAGGLIRVNEVSRIISGEFVLLVLGSSQAVIIEKAKGAPVEFTIPEDTAWVHFALMGVPRTSPNSNLAKLLINAVLSQEGQKLLYEVHATDHHELPGSQWAERMKQLQSRGIQPARFDVKFFSDHPEMEKLNAEFVDIMSKKSGS